MSFDLQKNKGKMSYWHDQTVSKMVLHYPVVPIVMVQMSKVLVIVQVQAGRTEGKQPEIDPPLEWCTPTFTD